MDPSDRVEQLFYIANFAFSIGIAALTISMLMRGGRPAHARSWIFFSLAALALLVHAGAALVVPDAGLVVGILRMTTTALLAGGFVFLYGADREGIQRLQQEAQEDSLTGLYNRRAFTALAIPRIERSVEHGGHSVVAILDLDGFKALNDREGHQAGDQMLQVVASSVRASIRPADIAGRYGGDEFVLLLDRCGADEARRIIQRILRHVLMVSIASGSHVTLSAGLAVSPAAGTDIRDLLHRADKALLEVKQSGKNGIAIAVPPAPVTDPANAGWEDPAVIAAPEFRASVTSSAGGLGN